MSNTPRHCLLDYSDLVSEHTAVIYVDNQETGHYVKTGVNLWEAPHCYAFGEGVRGCWRLILACRKPHTTMLLVRARLCYVPRHSDVWGHAEKGVNLMMLGG